MSVLWADSCQSQRVIVQLWTRKRMGRRAKVYNIESTFSENDKKKKIHCERKMINALCACVEIPIFVFYELILNAEKFFICHFSWRRKKNELDQKTELLGIQAWMLLLHKYWILPFFPSTFGLSSFLTQPSIDSFDCDLYRSACRDDLASLKVGSLHCSVEYELFKCT